MARGRIGRPERDTTAIPSEDELQSLLRPVTLPTPVSVRSVVERRDELPEVQDLRQFSFELPTPSGMAVTGVPAVVSVPSPQEEPRRRPPGRPAGAPWQPRFKFEHPEAVLVCVRRKERREVLFAKRRTRAGAGARRRRNPFSNIGC